MCLAMFFASARLPFAPAIAACAWPRYCVTPHEASAICPKNPSAARVAMIFGQVSGLSKPLILTSFSSR